MALAMIQYSNDYYEIYPACSGYTKLPNGTLVSTPGWAMQVYPYVKSFAVYTCPDDQIPRLSTLTKFPGTNTVVPVSYGMPDQENGGKNGTSPPYSDHAGMAGFVDTATKTIWNAWSVSQVQAPSTTIMILEWYCPYNSLPVSSYAEDFANAPSENFPCNWSTNANLKSVENSIQPQDSWSNGTPAHTQGWNYAFADGHVKFLAPQLTMGSAASCNSFGFSLGMWTVNPND